MSKFKEKYSPLITSYKFKVCKYSFPFYKIIIIISSSSNNTAVVRPHDQIWFQ